MTWRDSFLNRFCFNFDERYWFAQAKSRTRFMNVLIKMCQRKFHWQTKIFWFVFNRKYQHPLTAIPLVAGSKLHRWLRPSFRVFSVSEKINTRKLRSTLTFKCAQICRHQIQSKTTFVRTLVQCDLCITGLARETAQLNLKGETPKSHISSHENP